MPNDPQPKTVGITYRCEQCLGKGTYLYTEEMSRADLQFAQVLLESKEEDPPEIISSPELGDTIKLVPDEASFRTELEPVADGAHVADLVEATVNLIEEDLISPVDHYRAMTKKELVAECMDMGILFKSSESKEELVNKLTAVDPLEA
ncbi:hypothetical protein LCGC14_1107360 [marine sediment metagenome]|uniref:Uncharacterized protein n=1 Tax=marine sediment metagenome TaxID=412755 RepID=A0A0F9MVM8_9ZZZZ